MARINNDLDENLIRSGSPQDSLLYIRRTLEAAGRLSTVSGSGIFLVGVTALAAVLVNTRITGTPWEPGVRPYRPLGVWAVLLVFSAGVTGWSMARKSRYTGVAFWSPVLRKALWPFSAPMVLGAILSIAVFRGQNLELLPVIWLGCYGAALTAAGVMSVSPVRWMGISFLLLAASAAFLPVSAGLALLAAGFGLLHIIFGAYIHWRHDG
jgi:hypothetical protein